MPELEEEDAGSMYVADADDKTKRNQYNVLRIAANTRRKFRGL